MFSVEYYIKFNVCFIGFTGFDIDPSAVTLSKENAIEHNFSGRCDFILCDLKKFGQFVRCQKFSTVIVNLPTEANDKEIVLSLLKTVIHVSSHAVYLLYNSIARDFIKQTLKKMGASSKLVAELPLFSQASHTFGNDVKVDLVRFLVCSHD